MAGNKTALIVTDDSGPIKTMAGAIASALDGFNVVTVEAGDFSGTHLLPADICFFGSQAANPPSFKYLDSVLRHINLAGRPCGIFSCSAAGADYLRDMVHDSELAVHPDVLTEVKNAPVWAKNIAVRLKPVARTKMR
jgi:hypothetical protein